MSNFTFNESSEDSFVLTPTQSRHLATGNTIVLTQTTQVWTFTAAQYNGTRIFALDATNAQRFLDNQSYTGYDLTPNNTFGLGFINLPAGRYYFGSSYSGTVPTGGDKGFVEVSTLSLSGYTMVGNVPLGVSGNPGAWEARGFTITGSPAEYIETEGTGGQFMVMRDDQFIAFQNAYPNGYTGGSYSAIYTMGGASGGIALEIEGEMVLPPGHYNLVWINDTNSWQGGAANIWGYAQTVGNTLSTAATAGSGSTASGQGGSTGGGSTGGGSTGGGGATNTPTAGNDILHATAGSLSIFGGAGNDTITSDNYNNTYLRGDDGNDSIVGGAGFDDINGNMGNDTVMLGSGDSWAVGGKDNDSLMGGSGQNLVYGNIGNDTCDGGGGNDIVRGGQDNDIVRGGAGDDFVSGDKGDDTMTGGPGADNFHTFGDAGIDRVTDFNRAEGDRVQLDPGTTFTVAQVGLDVVITMGGGGQMILQGVSTASLTGAWIFGF